MSRRALMALLALLLVVNVPLAGRLLRDARLDRDGTAVTATVVEASMTGGSFYGRPVVRYRLPRDVDLGVHEVTLERETYRIARERGSLQVVVLPDDPTVRRVEGEHDAATALLLTLAADALVLLAVVWLVRRRRPGPDVA